MKQLPIVHFYTSTFQSTSVQSSNFSQHVILVFKSISLNLHYILQGDKLMRLPSYSYDKDDLARHLSIAAEDGPETVIEADDYLQPQQHAPPVPDDAADNNNFKVRALQEFKPYFLCFFSLYFICTFELK